MNDEISSSYRDRHSTSDPGYLELGNSSRSGLVDVWRALAKRKIFIAATVALFAGTGALHGLITTPTYAYTTIVEIATYYPAYDDRPQVVEPMETIRAKVADAYVPQVLQRHHKSDGRSAAEIKVEVPRNGRILVLRSRGRANDEELYAALHGDIVKRIQDDHSGTAAVAENALSVQIKTRQQSLSFLAEGAKRIESHLQRMDVEQEMLAKQIAETKRAIAKADGSAAGFAAKPLQNETRTVALLMLGNELHHNRLRLAELERRANFGLASERDGLLSMLSANERSQMEERSRLEQLQVRLASTRPTKAVTSAVRSLQPVGIPQGAIFLLWLLAGLGLAVLGVLLIEVIEKARQEALTSRVPLNGRTV
jgi:hypothetical protein